MSSGNIQIIDTDHGKVLKCPNYFNISQASVLHDSLQQLIGEKPLRVIIDSKDIETVDAAILQTLYAFIDNASQAGIDVSWSSVNDVVSQSACILGLASHLNLVCE